MSSNIHNPHDKLFKASLQHQEVAREFLEMCLPDDIKKDVDLSATTYCNTTFIDEQLKMSQSDVLFKTNVCGQESYIYILCEHQSTIDKIMPFRLMKYMVNVWDFHIQQCVKKNPLPLPMIYPLVFFTGKGPYDGPLTLWELCGENAQKMEDVLKSPLHLVDVNVFTESELTSRVWAGTMGFVMRQQFKQHLSEEIRKIIDNLNTIELNKHGRYVIQLVKYILNIDDDHRDVKELLALMHDKLSPEVEKEIMSLADRIEEKGLEKGMEKGKLELIKTMLSNGVEPAFIAKNTGVSMLEIKALQKEIRS